MPSSGAPIPKNLLNQARRNYDRMKQKQSNKLTQNLRAVRRATENKERVEKVYSNLQARLNALTRNSSNKFVNVTRNNLKGYNKKKSSKKTKGRSTTLNRMTKKVLNAFRK
jgi:hypothetical protein